jgi:2-haloacid dehalogenase
MPHDTILFDINETVLDLGSLKPRFKVVFGDESVTATWFSMLLHASTVSALTDLRTDFAALAGAMLDAMAARLGIELSPDMRADILGSFASMPPHADIKPALARLRSTGFRAVAFTNSSLDLVTTQINNAGLTGYFDAMISVEETGSFKPDPRVYRFAAERIGRPIEELRLVAAHDWDTHGALSAGMRAAYVARSSVPYQPLYRRPDIYAKTMEGVVEQIVARDGKN